jgi:hypothetical protein
MYWPYPQLESEDADYFVNEISDLTESGVFVENTGISILGRGVNCPTDESPKSPPELLQGTAKRRVRLLVNELYGSSCTIDDRKENKVCISCTSH